MTSDPADEVDGSSHDALDVRRLRRELSEVRAALERERSRSSGLFQLAPMPFVVTDRNGVVLDANGAAEQLFNVPREHLLGTSLAALAEGDSIGRALRAAGPHVMRSQLTLRPRHLQPVRVEAAVRLLDPLALREEALSWGFVDVEERQSAQERLTELVGTLEERVAERTAELSRERALLAAVLAQMPVGVAIAEAPTGRIVRTNERLGRLLGAEVRVDSIADYDTWGGLRPDGKPLAAEEWPLVRALRGEISIEQVAIVRSDGREAVLELTAAPIDDEEEGAVPLAVVVVRDVTERSRREQAERDFVTNAAHELQTPLAAIISAAEVLDAGAKEQPEDRDRFLNHIRRECDRLARLVRALLTLARAQTLGEAPPAEALELQPLLDEIALSLNPPAGAAVRVDCPVGLAVHVNPFLLEQALSSLGANAAKYASGGTTWLRARDLGDGHVEIEVLDEGMGIPAGEEERLFERFYRGGARDDTGFGLGLSVVRESVAALGGAVRLERRPGGGTSARIVLPAAEAG